ncbi:MAG TPA: D-glycero-beta-D-manno-heptose 1,7-bisphosphate 7-phosphatase [Gammaproteobacteria bacterium]|nr:D-glycero-beta-D-manno-heptose 1,7-bisphosphate 7-phosphatase [Gammaproteobacteria bacterium]
MSYIILDRDGVINFDSSEYIKSPDEWTAIPNSLEAIAALNRAGYKVLIATNQSGIARGYYDLETLDEIHEKLKRELFAVGGVIEEIFFCPHHPDDGCGCRKPKPGMLHAIQEKYDIILSETYFIGDSLADAGAARAAGCQLILVMTGNGQRTIKRDPSLSEVPQFTDLAEAVQHVLAESRKK